MRRQLQGFAALVFAVAMQSSFADDLGQDMQIMAKNYTIFQHTKNPQEAQNALTTMQKAVEDANTSIPMSLLGEADQSPKIQAYHTALKQLDEELAQTLVLVQAGQLQQAQEQAIPVIDRIKQVNHHEFR